MSNLEIQKLQQENKLLKRKLVLLKKKCNKLVVAAYNTSESDINKLSLLKKENAKLKKALKLLINRLNLKLYYTVLIGSCVIKVETEDYLNDNKDGNRRYYITVDDAKFLNEVFKEVLDA